MVFLTTLTDPIKDANKSPSALRVRKHMHKSFVNKFQFKLA